MTGEQHTNFKFLARHEDLRIRYDGGRLAELEPVGCVESRGRVKEETEKDLCQMRQIRVKVCFTNNGSLETFKSSIH